MSGRIILRVGLMAGFVLALGSVSPAQRPAAVTPAAAPSTDSSPASGGAATPAKGIAAPPGSSPAAAPAVFNLDDLTQLAMGQHPRLAQATFAIETASGQATQAGLYPNPTVSVTIDELGDRTGPAGIITAPLLSQEIVVAGKLRLSKAAAMKGVDQATLEMMGRRYALLGDVRVAYFDVLGLQHRVHLQKELVQLANESVTMTRKLLEAKEAAPLDVLQLEVELERAQAELAAAERELPGAYRRLAAVVGAAGLPIHRVAGSLYAPLPVYNLDVVQDHVLKYHPDVHAAQAAVERGQLLVQRQRVEPIPNPTVSVGYVYQGQNRSNDAVIGVSLPVPLWNRNQGNIAAAQGQLGEAIARVDQARNDLADRVGQAHREYAAARLRAERYRDVILPKAQETYTLTFKGYRQAGAFEYLRVIEAQRSLGLAATEYVRASQDAWRAAAVLSGLAMEDHWPPPPPPKPPAARVEELPAPRRADPEKNGNDKDRPPEEVPPPRRDR